MFTPLKQSTSATIVFYMYDSTDHVTPKTGLSPVLNVSKNGAAFVVADASVTEVANGLYRATLSTTDTNTVGPLACHVTASGADPAQFVLFVGATNVDVTHWGGTALPTPDVAGYPKVTIKTGTGPGELSITSGITAANAVQISGDSTAADNLEAAYDGTGYGDGTTTNAGTNSTTKLYLATSASTTNNFYNHRTRVTLLSGPAAGLSGVITAYAGATREATISPALPVAPTAAGGDLYILEPTLVHTVTADSSYTVPTVTATTSVTNPVTVGTNNDKTGYRLSAAGVDDVWDEAISGHLTSGSTGAALNAAGSSGDPWATPLPGAYGSGTAGKIIGDNLDATVSSRLAASAIALDGSGHVTVGAHSTAAKAEINAEVVDVVSVDTHSELSALPGSSPTLLQKIQFVYQALRNKMTQTSTTQTLFKNDGATPLGTASTSDDGTTTTRNRIV